MNPNPLAIGILVTDAIITRPPGDVGNPATYPFPVLYQRVPCAFLERIVEKEDPQLLSPILDAARELVGRGAAAIKGCGLPVSDYRLADLFLSRAPGSREQETNFKLFYSLEVLK